MPSLHDLLAEAGRSHSALAGLVVLACAALARVLGLAGERTRMRTALAVFGVHLLLLPAAVAVRGPGAGDGAYAAVQVAAQFAAILAVVGALGSLLFAAGLPRLGFRAPLILREILVAGVSVVALFIAASRAGFSLSGLIATSTVLTAVIGLSFQDTLGNVMAGLALQLDRSVQPGDWIRVGEVTGRVHDVSWRYTSLETRDWETVVVPNSVLVKNQFVVLGRRSGQPVQLRRTIRFNVDFRYAPTDVIAAVTTALHGSPLDGVAAEPPPDCIAEDLAESSFCRYAVRYWLADLLRDGPVDSAVRTRVYFGLRRAGIPLSIPAQSVFVTEESAAREERKTVDEKRRRREALRRVDFFEHIPEEERDRLAERLVPTPFAAGEMMTRQGDVEPWLYLLVEGEASVRLGDPRGFTSEVARLAAGSFFGEMSLVTGAPRSATVVASTSTLCYRLPKAAFQEVLQRRPDLAERVAEVLASRRYRLAVVEQDMATVGAVTAPSKGALMSRISEFFGLSGGGR